MIDDGQWLLGMLASLQSLAAAMSEWVDAQAPPWAAILRLLPLIAAFFLGCLLVVFWKKKTVGDALVVESEAESITIASSESEAEKKLPLLQNELKITLQKNQRQKEKLASAARALRVKDAALDKLEQERVETVAAISKRAAFPSGESEINVKGELSEDLKEFATASEQLVQAATEFREKLGSESFAEIEQTSDTGFSESPLAPRQVLEWDEMIIFCSSDPSIWDQRVNDGAFHLAVPLQEIPSDAAFLRLRRLDDGRAVVIAISRNDLAQDGGDAAAGFNGSNEEFYGARHLGVYCENLPMEIEVRFALGGWGFGHCRHRADNKTAQACAWAGLEITGDTVIEITVFPCMPELAKADQWLQPS